MVSVVFGFTTYREAALRGWFRPAAGGLPRTFWFLWTGTLINRLGSFVVIFLAIYLTDARGFSASRAGLVIGLYGVGGAPRGSTATGETDEAGRRCHDVVDGHREEDARSGTNVGLCAQK